MQRQQDYLVLLHHARKCPHDERGGVPCPEHPEHCAAAKRLWRHIAECQAYKSPGGCPDCLPARRLLTHYRNCRDQRCPTCGPVREAIRRRRVQQQQEQQQQQQQQQQKKQQQQEQEQRRVQKADTYSTEATTPLTPSPSHESTIDEWVTRRRLAIIDCPQGGRPFLPSGSISSLSHGGASSAVDSSVVDSSARSSIRSSIAGGSARSGVTGGSLGSGAVYCEECRRLGIGRPPRGQLSMGSRPRVCSGGIRCRSNLGIAHFCTVVPPRK